jgi:hypothetical protein
MIACIGRTLHLLLVTCILAGLLLCDVEGAIRGSNEVLPTSQTLQATKETKENELRPTDMTEVVGITEWHRHHEIIRYNMKNKLNHSKYTKFVDKLSFKEYCREKGVRTVETLASYPQSEHSTIPFESFGGNFAIKSNKGSHRNIFIKGSISKYNMSAVRKKVSQWGDDYIYSSEPQYEVIMFYRKLLISILD